MNNYNKNSRKDIDEINKLVDGTSFLNAKEGLAYGNC